MIYTEETPAHHAERAQPTLRPVHALSAEGFSSLSQFDLVGNSINATKYAQMIHNSFCSCKLLDHVEICGMSGAGFGHNGGESYAGLACFCEGVGRGYPGKLKRFDEVFTKEYEY
ncbi:hypothetical protein FRC12_006933 [Ceratobasidium sp. 428]|nr:hypothetical protein FRC12_006933 [Ceratobasidium sp. 428]